MLLGSGRGAVFPDSTVLQRRNSHLDVIHARLQPVYLATLGRWSRPRDLCVLRYWQQEEDGTCVICFQSIEDSALAPVDRSGRVVRARCVQLGDRQPQHVVSLQEDQPHLETRPRVSPRSDAPFDTHLALEGEVGEPLVEGVAELLAQHPLEAWAADAVQNG